MELSGRDRRLRREWELLQQRFDGNPEISCTPVKLNDAGMPVSYEVRYRIRSISGIVGEMTPGAENPPVFADSFTMRMDLPDGYPGIDALPVLRFLTRGEDGTPIPHPWHPNIRYYGDFAGRVCLNMTDSFTDLAWVVQRVASYLKYERYHALNEPPYPEDQTVAAWVVRQGEKNDWICF